MTLRKWIVGAIAALMLTGSMTQSQASPAAAAPGTVGIGLGLGLAGGIVGVVGIICIFDLILKIQGQKPWDPSVGIR